MTPSTQADGQTHSCENDFTADVWGRPSEKETTLSWYTSLDERCTHGEMEYEYFSNWSWQSFLATL